MIAPIIQKVKEKINKFDVYKKNLNCINNSYFVGFCQNVFDKIIEKLLHFFENGV